jgi:prepilin-type N-terminal cleavage/methylation domain-containing protein
MTSETTKESTRRDRGFTLVELLVVVTIMGVLSTVSVFAVRGITDKGQQSACDSDERVLEVAVETWFADETAATSGTLSEQALVDADLLRAPSDLFDVAADGSVSATAGGPCVAA